jgi:diguanylate cyclase (GGDEF)-like protein
VAAWVAGLLAGSGSGLEAVAPPPEVSQYAHESWTLASGLPQNSVTSIVQTRDGHLWFGTREGLVRFNGAQFRVYDHSNLPGLAQNDIRSLAEGSGGELWMIAAGMGLACLRDGKVQSYTMADGLPDNNPNMICCDGSGRLWVATSHGLALATSPGLTAGDSTGGAQGGQPGTASFWLPELLQHRNISALSLDSMGTIWIGTADGDVYRAWGGDPERAERVVSEPGRAITAIHRDPDGSLWLGTTPGGLVRWKDRVTLRASTQEVTAILHGWGGAVWVATHGGLLRVDGDGLHPWGPGLGDDLILALCRDREGSLWVGTSVAGLHRFSLGRVAPIGQPEGLAGDNISALLQARDGTVWAGTEGQGLSLLAPAGGWRGLGTAQGLPDPHVRALAEDPAGRVWVGTTNGLACFQSRPGSRPAPFQVRRFGLREGLEHRSVRCLYVDRAGDLWIGTADGTLHRWTRGDPALATVWRGRIRHPARCITQDRTCAIWLGTDGDGLYRYREGHFEHFDPSNGLAATVITSLLEDPDGRGLWIGSAGYGIFLHRAGGFQQLTSRQGLPDNSAFCFLDDHHGNVWMTSHKGLWRASRLDLAAAMEGQLAAVQTLMLGPGDGLRSPEFNAGCPPALRTRDGDLWFPSIKGLVRLDPSLIKPRTTPIPLILEEVFANGRELPAAPPGQVPTYGPGLHQCEFRYAALTFLGAGLQFQYRVAGLDPEWIAAGSRRTAYYTNLPPGSYTFQVQVRGSDGNWLGVPTSYPFEVRPYFYETKLFYLLAGLGTLLAGAGLQYLRGRQLRARNLHLEGLVKQRTAELEEAMQGLRATSLTDPLTGLWNRRFLTVSLPEEAIQSVRNHSAPQGDSRAHPQVPLDLLFFMIDLDHFKAVNDRLGHAAGDSVLRQMKGLLGSCTRDSDTVVRWGGEEFLVVGRRAGRADASAMAERIRSAVERHRFELGDGRSIRCTCSVGCAAFPFSTSLPAALDWEAVVAIADHCLYAAKRSGRNAWVELAAPAGFDPGALGADPESAIPGLIAEGKLEVRSSLGESARIRWAQAEPPQPAGQPDPTR